MGIASNAHKKHHSLLNQMGIMYLEITVKDVYLVAQIKSITNPVANALAANHTQDLFK
jgi:hypothetical protein